MAENIRRKNHRWKCFAAALFLMASLLLSGCRGMELENKTEQVDGYTKAQSMIVLVNERNRYQNLYGAGIWEARFGDTDSTFEEYMIQNVKSFLEQIKTITMLAEERGITVTSQERDALRTLSEQYYTALSDADRELIGCSEEDVQLLYTDYYLAEKTAAQLTASADSELSDSEVKIIQVEQIVTGSLKKAKALLKMIKIDGDDFTTMAARYSESDEIERTLSRGASQTIYDKTAFSLDEGQVSNIVEMDGMYYIIKCTNGYDEAATLARKDKLQKAILDQSFMNVYEPYSREHTVRFSESFWNRVGFSGGEESQVTNFFDLYRAAFPD
ncbi:MAG: peptidylprolyl isomerase [Eubacteriales bacterium]|nr:peptidylprolyl isomerase [Eubacteriales bacterium]